MPWALGTISHSMRGSRSMSTLQQPHHLPVIYSTIAPAALETILARDYQLDAPLRCTVWNRGFNDHYLVATAARHYMLRVYSPGKYWAQGPGDFRFELELLRHLHAHDVPVSYAIERRDGDLLGPIHAPEGERYVALFSYAPGTIVEQMDQLQSRLFGETVARLHLAADAFSTGHPRYHLDLHMLLEQPMGLIRQSMGASRPDALSFLERTARQLKEQVQRLSRDGGAYGIIHADLHGRNNHITLDNRLTLFDFDHCGFGWRAYDLAVFVGGQALEIREAFVEGYQSVRRLSDAELAAIPTFVKIRPIWDTGDILAMAHLFGVAWANDRHWDRLTKELRELMAEEPA